MVMQKLYFNIEPYKNRPNQSTIIFVDHDPFTIWVSILSSISWANKGLIMPIINSGLVKL